MTNWNAKQHGYEELRSLVIDELLARTCSSFEELQEKVSQAILKQDNQWPPRESGILYQGAVIYLHPKFGHLGNLLGFIPAGCHHARPRRMAGRGFG